MSQPPAPAEHPADGPSPRRSVEEHRRAVAALLASAPASPAETVPLAAALGRVTAAAIPSPVDLPLFRNSQMDGYAVRAADVAAARGGAVVELPVVGVIAAAAGEVAPLPPGTAARIMTGAPVPEGADAIVPVEDTAAGADPTTVVVRRARGAGEYVRERGDDLRAGTELLAAGIRLSSRHIAALAAAGIGQVAVRPRTRVAVITTGAELVAPGTAPGPGQVHDANGPALAAAVIEAGAIVSVQRRVSDDPEALREVLDAAAAVSDVILTCGGISKGDFEVVRAVLEPLGAWVGSVAMQPGGPQATAVHRGVPVVCAPGNPVSAQLSFELFVAPPLREAAGLPAAARERRTLTRELRSLPGVVQLLRARAVDGGRIEPVAGPGSHLVAAMARADRIIEVPAEIDRLDAGDEVRAWVL
jgi:molybdopterin molybdotransferase